MSNKLSNVAYNTRLNQICPIAYTTNYENSKQSVHKVAKGSFQTWADAETVFLTIHQVKKLMDMEEEWSNPTDEALSSLGLEKKILDDKKA